MILVDSNLVIYATQPAFAELRTWLLEHLPKISAVSRVEVLGYHRLMSQERVALEKVLEPLETLYPTPVTFELAIALRQQRKMSLGDALIAATCLEQQLVLATNNVMDFEWITGLALVNPLNLPSALP